MKSRMNRTLIDAAVRGGDVSAVLAALESQLGDLVEQAIVAGLRPKPARALVEPIFEEIGRSAAAKLISKPPGSDVDLGKWMRAWVTQEQHRAISRVVLRCNRSGRSADAAALAHVFYAGWVMARVQGWSALGADVDDVFQEVWLSVTKTIKDYQGANDATLRTWLYKLTTRKIADAWKLRKRDRDRRAFVDVSECDLPGSTPPHMWSTLRPSMRNRLWDLLDRECTAEEREILIQRFLVEREQQLSWKELALLWPHLGHPEPFKPRSADWLKSKELQLRRWLHERLSQ